MKILFIKRGMHHKNLNALINYTNIDIDIVDNLQSVDITKYDIIYSPAEIFDTSKYPNKKFIFGPHFSVFPNNKIETIINKNTIYIQPSEWAANSWKIFDICKNLNIQVLPFGVDTEKFNQNNDIYSRDKIFIYFKNRNPIELKYVEYFLYTQNLQYVIFDYKKRYNEQEYIDTLKQAKCGIWLGCHESQGFALEEALSCNVPLLVWSVKSMNQEYGCNYQDIQATSIPYWDERCGEVFYNPDDLNDTFKTFISKLYSYKPREYILENLSIDVCEQKFITLINNMKN
jgi:hypothetical protein